MDSTFFLFFEIVAFCVFFYSIEKETWHGLFIFLSGALFLALSIASYDISSSSTLFNGTSGIIETHTVSQYDIAISTINEAMTLLCGAIGFIKVILFKDFLKRSEEED